jgi:hypothetical protein
MHKTRMRCGRHGRSRLQHRRCRRASIRTWSVPKARGVLSWTPSSTLRCGEGHRGAGRDARGVGGPAPETALQGTKDDTEEQTATQEALAGQHRDGEHLQSRGSSVPDFDLGLRQVFT